MKLALYKKYNRCKNNFIKGIIKFLERIQDDNGLTKFAEPIVMINYSSEYNTTETETITEIQYTDNGYYAHVFITDDSTDETDEMWFGLDELCFNELYEIADKL